MLVALLLFSAQSASGGLGVTPEALELDGQASQLAAPDASVSRLRLSSFGFEGAQASLVGARRRAQPASPGRTGFEWTSTLEEWYLQRGAAIEHGFTLLERPPVSDCPEAELVFELQVDGGLLPRVAGSTRDAAFVDAAGVARATYTGLEVFDAAGRSLEARMEADGDILRIVVDEREAVYPILVDPLVQSAYVKASNTGAGDRFGRSVAVAGERFVVGAPEEDSSATGVGGNEGSNSRPEAGAAYVLARSLGQWDQEAYLKASNTEAGDLFGATVAFDGDTLVIGAHAEDSASAIDPSDNGAPGAGAVYVFRLTLQGWVQEAYLKASNLGPGDSFGFSVAVEGDRIVVGAPEEDSPDGTMPLFNSAPASGAAYVFERSGGVWSEVGFLKAEEAGSGDNFGDAVAIADGVVLVGAPREDSGANQVGGDATDNTAPDAGAVYVFEEMGGIWVQSSYLKAANAQAGDYFGDSVALDQGRILVGAPLEDSGVPGVNGDPDDNTQFSSGAAYTFRVGFADWFQEDYLKASNPGAFDRFGAAVALSGETVVVGAAGERSGASGVNGNQNDNSAGSSGAAYVFTRAVGVYGQIAYVKASNTNSLDAFGVAVALDDAVLVVGASGEDGSATGVNGAEFLNNAPDAGAAYAFDLYGGAITSYCEGAVNSTGLAASMGASGSASVFANDLELRAANLPQNAFGVFLASRVRGFVAMPGTTLGNLCLAGSIGRYVGAGQIQQAGATGTIALLIDNTMMPQPNGFEMAQLGTAWHFQAWYRDTVLGGATSNLTDGLTVLFE